MRPVIHAPDGGIVGHALCENPRGDVTDYERDVDCPDCLDALDGADIALRQRLRKHGFQFLAPQIGRVTRTGAYLTETGVESGTVTYNA